MKIDLVYLSGQMTNLPNFGKGNFFRAEGILKKMGIAVINPANLPDGQTWEEYLNAAYQTLKKSRPDYLVLLPNWRNSAGAIQEKCWAEEMGIKVIEWDDLKSLENHEDETIISWKK